MVPGMEHHAVCRNSTLGMLLNGNQTTKLWTGSAYLLRRLQRLVLFMLLHVAFLTVPQDPSFLGFALKLG